MATLTEDCKNYSEKRKIVTLEERKGRKYIATNVSNSTLTLYTIDGCVVKTGNRCDFLLVKEKTDSYFIELKGSDLGHAVEQIDTTINQLADELLGNVHGRIVLSRAKTPDLKSSSLIKLELKLKRLGGSLKKQVNQLEENV